MTKPRLTIVLPLRGRHLFTLRFLWHANAAQLPYRILIADGQVNEAVARHIENSREVFPNLDIDYVRYPNDTDYSRFFAKMTDALARVRTPYAMLADNDDFLGPNGIEQALDFLENNPDYIAARGRRIAFSAYSGLDSPGNNVHGRLNSLRMVHEDDDIASPLVTERLRQGGLSLLIYYAVYRTEALATLWREDRDIDFTDLMLHETYHAMRTLTLGKVRTSTTTISYFAQIGTSSSSDPMRNWVSHLLRSRFTAETAEMVKRIAAAAGADAASAAEQARSHVESYFREFLWSNYGLIAEIKRALRRTSPAAVKYWQSRPQFSAGRQRKAVLGRLAAAGASQQDLSHTRAEMAAVENALSPLAFAAFAGPFLAMAQSGGSRDWV